MKNNLIWRLTLIAIFFLPLNGLGYGKEYFGELYVEGSYYILYIIFALFILKACFTKTIKIPQNKSFFILIILLVYFTFSGIINVGPIFEMVFKGRSGVGKFSLQFLVFLFVAGSSVVFYNVFLNFEVEYVFKRIRQIIIFSFALIFVWGVFEYLDKFISLQIPFFTYLDALVHQNIHAYPDRLRFFTGEPSYYGIYLTFAFPFILSLFKEFTNKSYLTLTFLYIILIFSYYTFSRTVEIILIFQSCVFVFFHWVKHRNLKKSSKYMLLILLPLLIVFMGVPNTFSNGSKYKNLKTFDKNSTDKNSRYAQSNSTRAGMQLAGFKIGFDNPIFGVGLGQFAFHFSKYLNASAKKNFEIKNYLNQNKKVWPPVHGLYARLAAEIGFVGLFIWLFFWGYIFYCLFKALIKDQNNSQFYLLLLTIIAGLSLLGFCIDSFRFMGYWIVLALSWSLLDNKDEKSKDLY